MNLSHWWHRLTRKQHNASTRDAWPVICTTLAQNFEEQRQECWSTILRRLDLARAGDDPIILPIVQRSLGGNGELALKAFQLHVASFTIATHAYVSPANGRDFTNHLYAQVCGTALPQALQLVASYYEVDTSTAMARLAGDVGRYMIGEPLDPQFYAFSLLPLDWLATSSMIFVCNAFNDVTEGERLLQLAIQRMEKGSLP